MKPASQNNDSGGDDRNREMSKMRVILVVC